MTIVQSNKTKLVCTIGPASNSPQMIEKMIHAGMNIARLNFSHGDFESHGVVIKSIKAASQRIGKRVAISSLLTVIAGTLLVLGTDFNLNVGGLLVALGCFFWGLDNNFTATVKGVSP